MRATKPRTRKPREVLVFKSPFLTINEASDYLNVHTQTLYRHVTLGKLPAFKVGGGWRIHKDELDRLFTEEHVGKSE